MCIRDSDGFVLGVHDDLPVAQCAADGQAGVAEDGRVRLVLLRIGEDVAGGVGDVVGRVVGQMCIRDSC